jgi:hypothetical protein
VTPDPLTVPCPACLAAAGDPCTRPDKRRAPTHSARTMTAEGTPVPSRRAVALRKPGEVALGAGRRAKDDRACYRVVDMRRLSGGRLQVAVRVDALPEQLIGFTFGADECDSWGPDEKALRRRIDEAVGRG